MKNNARSSCGVPPRRRVWREQRAWRRLRAVIVQDRRVREYIKRYLNYTRIDQMWTVRQWADAEVRQHLLLVRLVGEGEWGTPWGSYIEWRNGQEVPNTTMSGSHFQVVVKGRYVKTHALTHRMSHEQDVEAERRRQDECYRWTQSQLQQLAEEYTT